MEVIIKETVEKPLLSRKEVYAEMNYSGATPRRLEVRDSLASKLKVLPELVVIKNISPVYGQPRAAVTAHVYSDRESLKKNEPGHTLVRMGGKRVAEKTGKAEGPAAKEKHASDKSEAES
ncbi:30S ribosomal protein S24e [Candidatus Woesearchaeota archaeon CG08_land_8_20_14_0_20_47_9]|nr:MAG: hypothetical protein AUJ69_03615 [Candidatus Woesearchaeota archaeon CG1_02_47_18]PIN72828.1 MAG: 30S ribosomal protein S24e [Candidatus Woesearchaeota archaeon CG10_big_fil_rev_8_21_14_0_10_47_5]PIO03392.1 MAG: 30S ribosomal protein S24e [Candidatus Woesearchaeota archaeon CG08_land_8_20_14_0_20_47_9]HII29576.1 30S ribosomal protein S24e [Candidatus Woesearchaeota archaeon]